MGFMSDVPDELLLSTDAQVRESLEKRAELKNLVPIPQPHTSLQHTSLESRLLKK
jgi:hypothetical protein